ncbi:MAG: hypothetical protein J7647_01645 [Cyanobacteria bacterium SBLK]|nr:hypothetical protein [Cyanobacteria bacterium SBLK]
MNLLCYHKLGTHSRRALTRLYRPRYAKKRTRLGNSRYYLYVPRGDLLERLAKELNMTKPQVLDQLKKERVHLLQQDYPSDEHWKPWDVC